MASARLRGAPLPTGPYLPPPSAITEMTPFAAKYFAERELGQEGSAPGFSSLLLTCSTDSSSLPCCRSPAYVQAAAMEVCYACVPLRLI